MREKKIQTAPFHHQAFNVIPKDTSQDSILNFSLSFFAFFFYTAKFTPKSLNIWSYSWRCYPWFPDPCWPSSLDGFEGKMTGGMSGSS